MKNLIKNILKEKISTKSKELIYETESELDEVGRPRLFSNEDIIERACQYTNQRDFENSNDKNYFYLAKNRKLLPHIRIECGYRPLGNAYSRMLYMYIWEKNVNAVYFGLTCDEERRYEEHTRLEQEIIKNADVKPTCKVGANSAVKDFIQKHGYHDRYVMISDGYIDAFTAALAERCLIDHFRNDDEWKGKIQVINKSKGGELGGRCPANARRMMQDVKLIMDNQLNTPEEFQQNYPTEYEYWSKDKNRQKIFNQGLKKRFFQDAPYSKDEILKLASNYDNLDDFKNENERAFLSARRNRMIDILFPKDNVYFDPNTNKTYKSLTSLNKDLNKDFKDLFNDFLRGQGELDYGIVLKPNNEINETKSLIKSILKEESKNLEKEKKGIDLTIKMLKKSYPYIIGWKYSEEHPESPVYINIDIICDIEKTKEFYNSDLKWYYKKNPENIKEDDYAYPFTILEIGEKMTSEEKFEEHRKFRKQLNEIYEMLPENLIILSKWGEPKEIDPDKYFFV